MRKNFKRSIALLLALVSVLSLAACAQNPAKTDDFDPMALFYTLVKDVKYASELENAGESAALYFPDMPAGAELLMYKGSGYYADEVVLVTLADKGDMDSAKALLRRHLTQLREQFQNYQPTEVGKIDKAVLWHQGTTVILCVTDDTKTVQTVLENPADCTLPQQTDTPSVPATEETQSSSEATEPSQETTVPPTDPTKPTEEETQPPTDPTDPTEPKYVVPKDPAYKDMDLSAIHYYGDGFIRVGDRAFENHVRVKNSMSTYAALVNKTAKELGSDVKVYDLLIPTAIGIVLPEEAIANYEDYVDMGASIQMIFDQIDDSVVKVNCYDNLRAHKDEYLYFRTDFHWNGPAAYYAYESLCEAKGVAPYTLDQREEYQFKGFLGRLYSGGKAQNDPIIANAADTVYAYGPKCDVSMEITDSSGKTFSWPVIVNVDGWASDSKYNCFAGSDNPLTVFQNKDVTDGSKCIVIKESFGNAMMPFIADHYQTVYEIDYRHWEGDLIAFAKKNGVKEVIFLNNMSMLRNDLLIGMLGEIIK